MLRQDGVEILVASGLAQWAKAVHVGLSSFLFWTRFVIEAEPKQLHAHGPT